MLKLVAVLAVAVLASSCRRNPADEFNRLSDEFVYTTLSFSPSGATAAGLHQYKNQNLDDMLDDFSPANLGKQRQFYQDFQRRLAALPAEKLAAEDRADIQIMQDQIGLALLDLDQVHTPSHNPTLYVETLGNALFNHFVLEYAAKPDRIRHIIARLQKVPLYLDQASTNLVSSPSIWTQVAQEENEGNIDLVDRAIRAGVPEDLKSSYDSAAKPALDAMHKFQDFLKNKLSALNDADWRLGGTYYPLKFRYMLESGTDPGTTLEQATQQLQKVRQQMMQLALPLHRQMYPGHKDHPELSGDAQENKVIGEVLDKIAERHSTRETYMEDARKDLDEARAFVQEKHLLTLPTRSNLQVIPTPEFMRGIYAVGGFSAAPALEPQLGAFYWITPIPPDWPKERVESKLREYNFYKLKLLTIHEAMPGHYVQLEMANKVQPKTRRVLRSVYGNGPYIEGWGQYSEQLMIDQGFLNHSPEMALTFAKEDLRVIANAIIDIRLQMLNMTDQEALDLMEKQTFQETEEASAKLQRAKLSSCQLPMYFVGWRGWLDVRNRYQQAKGQAYNLSEFNDQALAEGSVPLPLLSGLLLK
ncbi:MAG TPA: DUF885 domain-containing protein [Bryobacteraceae bacterium]|nr:DUF885 domain-containing protein [Bryobacteraceae bacterium]